MKALLLASLIPALALTWSAAGPVDTHIATLQKATALSVKYKVVQAGSSPQDHSLSLSRDLKMRLETPAMLWVSDGKTLSTYNKAKQTYTQIPADKPTLAKLLQGESTWAWSAFLDPEFAKPITSAKPGDEINQKGVILQEIKISRPAGAITEMFDGAMGVFRGASYTKDQVQVFVQVTEIKVTDKPLPDALFVDITTSLQQRRHPCRMGIWHHSPRVAFRHTRQILSQRARSDANHPRDRAHPRAQARLEQFHLE